MAVSSDCRFCTTMLLIVMLLVAGVKLRLKVAVACEAMLAPTFCAAEAVNGNVITAVSSNTFNAASPTLIPAPEVGGTTVTS